MHKVSQASKPGNLVLLSLLTSRFAVSPPTILASLLLVDIALTFNQPVAAASLLHTASNALAVITALAIAALSTRYSPTSLLLYGLLIMATSALACGLAPTFIALLIAYSITGIGRTTVTPMIPTLVGEIYPPHKRTRTISLVIATGALSVLLGAPLTAIAASIGGWRTAFLALALPAATVSLALSAKVLLHKIRRSEHGSPASTTPPQRKLYSPIQAYRNVLTNKSAAACLAASILTSISWQAIWLYSSPYYRQQHNINPATMSTILLAGAALYILGSLAANRAVKKHGKKRTAALTSLLAGAAIAAYTATTSLALSLAAAMISCTLTGTASTALSSLTLEQTPETRGTMMSLNLASGNIGLTLGAALGTLVLTTSSYTLLGATLGATDIIAAAVITTLITDPVT